MDLSEYLKTETSRNTNSSISTQSNQSVTNLNKKRTRKAKRMGILMLPLSHLLFKKVNNRMNRSKRNPSKL